MGAGSTLANVLLFLAALERVLPRPLGYARRAAARCVERADRREQRPYNVTMRRRLRMRTAGRIIAVLLAAGFACAAYIYLTLPDVRVLRTQNPIDHRVHRACARGRRSTKASSRGASSAG